MEMNKKEILGLNLTEMYIEFQSIKEQIIGIPIIIENNQKIYEKKIDFKLRNELYDKVNYGINISIHILDIINLKYIEKWKKRIVYFGDYNNRKKTDYYKFQEEIINRKTIMVNVINSYYNYKEKSYI
ncbi:MAG: hypothetical protein PHN22_05155 [Candidatus ainarchaeum sp.]|nr:hypothetical protein [Candidatus ainarchaeum sp.]